MAYLDLKPGDEVEARLTVYEHPHAKPKRVWRSGVVERVWADDLKIHRIYRGRALIVGDNFHAYLKPSRHSIRRPKK